MSEPLVKYGDRTVYLVTNPDGWSYLSCGPEASDGYTSVPATAADLNMVNVAAFLDQQEEGANRHTLVGAYTTLLGIVAACAGDQVALAVMVRLMEMGGFSGQGVF